MARPFDVVWFTNNGAEAMRALKVLSVEERQARGITHPFKLWYNCPIPLLADGKYIFKERGVCVMVKYPGVIRMSPGRTRGNEPCVAEDCEGIQELAPGIVAAYIKPEVFNRLEFVKTAEEEAEREENTKAKIEDAQAEKAEVRQNAHERYFIAACHMAGVKHGKELTFEERRDIASMFSLSPKGAGVLPRITDWVNQIAPATQEADPRQYDPATALPALQAAYNAVVKSYTKTKKSA